MKDKTLYDYEEENNITCEHEWNKPIRENKSIIQVRVNGDIFVQEVKCSKCGVEVDFIFSNKHPEQYIHGTL
jgi:hypothetical protein